MPMVSLLRMRTCYAEAAPHEGTGQARGGEASGVPAAADAEDQELDLTREGPARYLAYAARVKKFIAVKAQTMAKVAESGARYVAYSSDIGEAFRPIVPSWSVNLAYAIAIGYIGADVAYHGYREQEKGGDVKRAVAHATTFQMLASLIVPTLAIHSIVHQAHAVTKRTGRFTKWGPTVAGLIFIPALPYAVDEPIEHAVDYCFDKYWPVVVAAGEANEANAKKQQ